MTANVGLKVHAYAGAKISLLGYDLAQWSTETVLAGPWTIYKYPSDGSEHKDPDQQKQDAKNSFWNKAVTAISDGSASFIQVYETIINQLMDMDDLTRDEAISIIANSVLNGYDITKTDLTNTAILNDLRHRHPVIIHNKQKRLPNEGELFFINHRRQTWRLEYRLPDDRRSI